MLTLLCEYRRLLHLQTIPICSLGLPINTILESNLPQVLSIIAVLLFYLRYFDKNC